MFFSDFDWHDLGFLGKILIFLGFLGKINSQDLDNKIQDYAGSWQENQDAKHWVGNSISNDVAWRNTVNLLFIEHSKRQQISIFFQG